MKIRKMRIRKRRGTLTKATMRKARNRLMPWKNPKKNEVKHLTMFTANPTSANLWYPTIGDTTLANNQVCNFGQYGILGNIVQGTNTGNRIGANIYVKFVRVKLWIYICPASTDTEPLANVSIRLIVFTKPFTYGITNLFTFFNAASRDRMINYVDRTYTNVYYDKVYQLTAVAPLKGSDRSGDGGPRLIKFNIPIGRRVEYVQNTNTPKNERDQIQCAVIAQSPNATTDQQQLACYYWNARIYFTDN